MYSLLRRTAVAKMAKRRLPLVVAWLAATVLVKGTSVGADAINVGCGDDVTAVVVAGGSVEWAFAPPLQSTYTAVLFATCNTDGDTVLSLDGREYDDEDYYDGGGCGTGGRNERVLSLPVGSVAIRVRFYNSSMAGTIRLGVECSTTPPTLSPTTHAPTTSGATFAPTAIATPPVDGIPETCGYGRQVCSSTEYCCGESGLRAAPGRATYYDVGTTLIFLNGNELTSVPAGTFSGLTTLTQLYLASNQISVLGEGLFAGLTALVGLYLSQNRLTAVPVQIGNLAALTVLHLFQNQLTSLPAAIGDLAALTELDLSLNQLTSLPAEIGSLASLTTLYLQANRVTFLPGYRSGLFTRLEALTELDLSSNSLTVLVARTFSGLIGLTWLDLSSNQIAELGEAVSGLTALTQLDVSSNFITAPTPWTFTGLTALVRLRLQSNFITVLTEGLFSGLSALADLDLSSNQILDIGEAVSGLSALTRLDLSSNQIRVLRTRAFASLVDLQSLDLGGNRIQQVADATFDFSAMRTGLAGETADGVPRFIYNPNPLQCGNSSAGTAAWDGAGPLRCTRCTQGYAEAPSAGSPQVHGLHTACVRPSFTLDTGPDAQRSLNALRDGLAGRVAYIGEELDVYQDHAFGDRIFEPTRDKFRGYASENGGFSAIRFEVKVGGVDIGCGAVVAGGLNGAGSEGSRIRQYWRPPWGDSFAPVPLSYGRQHLLQFEVLADGHFGFSSCGSRFPASLGVYDASSSCSGTGGSLVGCLVAPYTEGHDRQFPQADAPPLHLPGRYSCPVGSSANLSNVHLTKGTYLLGVQPLPDSPTPDSPNDVFEVEMRCQDDSTAAPLDPLDGGVVVNPVTGQLTVSPGDRAIPGSYSLALTAVDSVGTTARLLTQTLQIRRRPQLALTAGCGARMNSASSANIRAVNGPSHRHDLGSVVVFPAFLNASVPDCGASATFDNAQIDRYGDPLILYDVAITAADGTPTDLGQDASVNGRTGKLSFTLEPILGAGTYTVTRRASTGDAGSRLVLQAWNMDLRHSDTSTVANGPDGRGCGAHGTPVDGQPQDDAYTCVCDPGSGGDNCETSDSSGAESASGPLLIASGVLNGVLVVVVVVLAQSLCKQRKSGAAAIYREMTTNAAYDVNDEVDYDRLPADSYEDESDAATIGGFSSGVLRTQPPL